MTSNLICAPILCALFTTATSAQVCPVASDINPALIGWNSDPSPDGFQSAVFGGKTFTQLGSQYFFSATTQATGTELYVTDGTPAGTTLVMDINPAGSSTPFNMVASGAWLFFSASDPVNGGELWKTQGTSGTTSLVKDIWPGVSGSVIGAMIAFQGGVMFQANEGPTGAELYFSDGTAAGTGLVADLVVAPGSSSPRGLVLDASGTKVLVQRPGTWAGPRVVDQ